MAVQQLEKSLKAAAAANFNASRRLESHDKRLTRLIAFVSAYVIILTIFPYFLKMDEETRHLYDFVTVVFAIIILISSLLQYSNNNPGRAEMHLFCGLEINELHRALLLDSDNIEKNKIEKISTRYGEILQKYGINHDEIDYRQYQLDEPEKHHWMTPLRRWATRVEILRRRITPDLFLAGITLAFSALIWFVAAPHFRH